jgi:long-subunit acyl-CoA synthetase (AMP-forming)
MVGEPETICSLFQRAVESAADAVALRREDGAVALTWTAYGGAVRRAASGLAALGVSPGDTVACWLRNRPEFHVADAAAVHLGAAGFSIYSTYTVEQASHVISDADCRVLVTEPAFLDKALAVTARDDTPLETIVLLDEPTPGTVGWAELLSTRGPDDFDFESRWRAVTTGDLATVIYTSGTTGPPKGVELTHANLLAQLRALRNRFDYPDGARLISYLPMAHIAERINTHYLAMALRAEVTSIRDPRSAIESLQVVRPQMFFSPPRVWEKLRGAAMARLEPDAIGENGIEPQRGDVILKQFGFDQLRIAVVGAAPCPPRVIEFWRALGVDLVEVYGLTESTGVATAGTIPAHGAGGAGKPLEDVEVRIGDHSEVLIRGPIVMRGYRNLPRATAEAIDRDGWLHTGDVGAFDEEGNLRIVDRLKEIIVNSSGKNMSPANIEAALRSSSPLIAQGYVVGDGRPYNTALITLDPLGAAGFEGDLDAEVWNAVGRANETLARVEQIKRFVVLATDWEPGGDELTPTMKLKRRAIEQKYAAEIGALYE